MKRQALFATFVAAVLVPAGLASAAERPAAKASAALRAGLSLNRTELVWVYLADKGPRPAAESAVTPRARARRALRGDPSRLHATLDAPVHTPYVQAVTATGARLRQQSRWFNAVSVEATAAQVAALEALPFVERLDIVRRYHRGRDEMTLQSAQAGPREPRDARGASPHAFDYGTSAGQLTQINVPAVHDAGLHGEGVVIAVLDAGFNNLSHASFSSMAIMARRDFVNGDDDVADGSDHGEGSHGTMTLSAVGGFAPGQLIGPAFASTYLLAKTENTDSETPAEEDAWAAAAEWAESLGADVISSSLGYLDFDNPAQSYTPAQMNGEVAISTRAADLAAAHGIVVVNSAGNQGFNATQNTLGAPADGNDVIAVGAVTSAGTRATFSSVGPSADGRIKPDVSAQGVAVKLASPYSPSDYTFANGTSFSCPLTAGVVALVLQAHPTYTPKQVATVLRGTGSQAAAPDNSLGYGIVNALAAVQAQPPADEGPGKYGSGAAAR